MVLGDPAYPSLSWLMEPFPDNAFKKTFQMTFNYRQSRARMAVENSSEDEVEMFVQVFGLQAKQCYKRSSSLYHTA